MTYSINLDVDGGEIIGIFFEGEAIAGGSDGFVWVGEAMVDRSFDTEDEYAALRKVFWSMYQTVQQHGTLVHRVI